MGQTIIDESMPVKVVVLGRKFLFQLKNQLLGVSGCTNCITLLSYCKNDINLTSLFHCSYLPLDFVWCWHQEYISRCWSWWGSIHGATSL